MRVETPKPVLCNVSPDDVLPPGHVEGDKVFAITIDELRAIAVEMTIMGCAMDACSSHNEALKKHIEVMNEEVSNGMWWKRWSIPIGVASLLGGFAAGIAVGLTR